MLLRSAMVREGLVSDGGPSDQDSPRPMLEEELNLGWSGAYLFIPLERKTGRGVGAPEHTRPVPRSGRQPIRRPDTEPSAPEPGLQPRTWIRDTGTTGSVL